MMILQVLHCPHCQGTDIVRHGQTRQGKQRYRYREQRCAGRTFLLDYTYAGQSPDVKRQSVDMAMNASGIRDTARVLHVSPNTVIKELKKKEPDLQLVNQAVLAYLHPEQVEVAICRADELDQRRGLSSELDQMWSYVGKKAEPRWLWHAIDHQSGTVEWYRVGIRFWAAEGCGLSTTTSFVEAVWYHAVLHRWMGGVRAVYRPSAASSGQGEHAENRE